MLIALLFATLAQAESRDLNAKNSGWTELPHGGGDVTIEDPRPKPKVTPKPIASAAPELESLHGLSADDRELLRPQLERQKVLAGMNANNPMSETFQVMSLKEMVAQRLGISPELLDKASSSKALGRVTAFASTPESLSDLQQILATPIHSPWIAAELGWIVFFFVLRAWRLSKAKGIGRRLFEHAWLSCSFALGGFFVIPWLVYGKPFARLLSGAAVALFS